MQRERQPEGEQTVFCLKGAQTAIALGNGLDAIATIAVIDRGGNRQTISDNYITGIGILNLHTDFVLLDI